MLPILDEKAEKDASVPKVLGIIQDSQGSVLTVKFSHCGTMLAAGCDAAADSAVLIFKQSSAPAVQKQLGCKITSIENWRPVGSLRGHQLDVTALSWSSGDEYLASASMDQKVYIWGIGKGGCRHSSKCGVCCGAHAAASASMYAAKGTAAAAATAATQTGIGGCTQCGVRRACAIEIPWCAIKAAAVQQQQQQM